MMDNQITMMGFETPDYREALFLETVLPIFKSAVSAKGSDGNLVSYRATQVDSKSSGYTAVFFHNFTAFRLRLRGKQHYISLPLAFVDLVPDEFPVKQLDSDTKYLRILIDENHTIESYTDFLTIVVGETVNRYPTEWSCCSRFDACSDAKACIHPDKTFALGCGYRKILNSGRIFYGKNRNID